MGNRVNWTTAVRFPDKYWAGKQYEAKLSLERWAFGLTNMALPTEIHTYISGHKARRTERSSFRKLGSQGWVIVVMFAGRVDIIVKGILYGHRISIRRRDATRNIYHA